MRGVKRYVVGLALLALLALPFLIYFNAQALTDWWQLRGYTPPLAVSSLASQDTMTAYGRHIFYVNHPDLESDASTFRKDCNISEQAIVLGCYHSDQDGIFIYNVTDSRLNGVEQVTAAHEMLHGAYDRLSNKDKNYVDGLLQSFYQNNLHDQRVIDEINEYKVTEPNDVVNEMHSVFGTEVADLPAPLEAYYQRYFTNRSTITNFASAYQSEFTDRENQIKADDAKLETMKSQIDAEEQSLSDQQAKISSDRARLNSLRASGRVAEYNSGVDSFNQEIDSYNSGVAAVRADINSYNQLVDERNAIAGELASLDKALDTRQAPQTIK
jgi:phage shock protein A